MYREQPDPAVRVEAYRALVVCGRMTVNEARRAQGLAPLDSPFYDGYFVPLDAEALTRALFGE